MCRLPMSDKGWLRQYWPQHSPNQLERFIGLVVKRLNYVPEPPSDRQIAEVRWAAYRDMKGTLE